MAKDHDIYESKAKMILAKSNYMVVGTSTKNGKPWVAPVLFVHDDNLNLYFLSAVDALHSKNILENGNVSISIFDSHQKIGDLEEGIQAEGKATLVEEDNIERVISMYRKKAFPNSKTDSEDKYAAENYLGVAEFRFFKVKLIRMYVNGEDRRVEVDLPGR